MDGPHRRGTARLAIVAAMVALALAGCTTSGTSGTGSGTGATTTGAGTAGGGAGAQGATVVESGYRFAPSTLSVAVGATVTFKNQDSAPHHVVVGTTDLGVQQPGQDVTWTADRNGTVAFTCLIHPSMTGQVTVGTGGGNTPATSGTDGGSAPPTGGGTGGGSAPPAGGGGYSY